MTEQNLGLKPHPPLEFEPKVSSFLRTCSQNSMFFVNMFTIFCEHVHNLVQNILSKIIRAENLMSKIILAENLLSNNCKCHKISQILKSAQKHPK